MRYIKCFFKSVTSSKTSLTYYMYSQSPSFQCRVKLNKKVLSLPVTLGSGKVEDALTMWIGNSEDMTAEEASQYSKTFGQQAYFAVDADNNIDLVSELPKDSKVITSIFAS